mmetsp:Transcript_103490/g.262818  ORF Transcript_103490/g.262818 Transcript_103490/m.262818 type:complete len:352 (-) Transcript_103490:62-1117(-)
MRLTKLGHTPLREEEHVDAFRIDPCTRQRLLTEAPHRLALQERLPKSLPALSLSIHERLSTAGLRRREGLALLTLDCSERVLLLGSGGVHGLALDSFALLLDSFGLVPGLLVDNASGRGRSIRARRRRRFVPILLHLRPKARLRFVEVIESEVTPSVEGIGQARHHEALVEGFLRTLHAGVPEHLHGSLHLRPQRPILVLDLGASLSEKLLLCLLFPPRRLLRRLRGLPLRLLRRPNRLPLLLLHLRGLPPLLASLQREDSFCGNGFSERRKSALLCALPLHHCFLPCTLLFPGFSFFVVKELAGTIATESSTGEPHPTLAVLRKPRLVTKAGALSCKSLDCGSLRRVLKR